MEVGIIGLGKMGSGLALQALEKDISVVGFTRGRPGPELLAAGLKEASDISHLIKQLRRPRKILLYIPAGPFVDDCLSELMMYLEPGDIIMDGGNSYWGDSLRRFQELKQKGIHFLDVGTSGGISGAREGACFMVGGDHDAYAKVEPLLQLLAVKEGCAHVGPSGSGHLVKLIHNGIEFGMLQAIGEGMSLLEKFRKQMPLNRERIFQAYRNGSVIRSWLIDLMAQEYQKNSGVEGISSHVEDTGEVNWLLSDAIHLEVPIPIITQSIMELFRSRDTMKSDYRSVSLMRHGFGGHPFGPKLELEIERRISRLSPGFPEEKHEH